MTVAALSTAVQARIGSTRLAQLTNDDGAVTTINTTVLEAACQDAIGTFERLAGLTADTSNVSFLPILIDGVLYFLENYKGRENAVTISHQKSFIAGCSALKALGWVTPTSTSNIAPSRETAGSLPDMDRSKKMWTAGGTTIGPQEISVFSE